MYIIIHYSLLEKKVQLNLRYFNTVILFYYIYLACLNCNVKIDYLLITIIK